MNYVRRMMFLPNGRKAEVVIVKDRYGNIVDWYGADKERRVNGVVVRERRKSNG